MAEHANRLKQLKRHIPGQQMPECVAPPFTRRALAVATVVSATLAAGVWALEQFGHTAASSAVPPYTVIPFALLLASIAAMPLIALHWWERNYSWVAVSPGLIVAGYYLAFIGWSGVARSLAEYLSFIFLLASLYVVSGGILIHVRSRATPLANTTLLLIGAILANVFGTTGAAVLLIRPFIRMNGDRVRPYHIVFFIFIVANAGGSLTPIGDPPLFLGYLRGVPFFWVLEHCWPISLTVNGLLLATFLIFDWSRQSKRTPPVNVGEGASSAVSIRGGANLIFIAMIVFAAAAGLHAPWRELVMASAAIASLATTARRVHIDNQFNFAPIREVAILFFGIFLTMLPALDYLSNAIAQRGNPLHTPAQYYFACGGLSAVLDNAPTYLTFLAALLASTDPSLSESSRIAALIGDPQQNRLLVAISMGAVMFGAATYVGNGPNFMVKSIAEHAGVRMPGFFAYIFRFTLPILAPVLLIAWFLYLR